MDITEAMTPMPPQGGDEGSVSAGPAGLSHMQRDFALHFVLTGGKARRAAILAGYSAKSSSISAHRNLVNGRVLAEVKRLAVSNVQAALPVAIRTLIDVAINSKDDKARVAAANSLLDRGGMAAPKGGVQVNVGVQVNGNQVQTLIGEIWDAKSRRLSDIPPAMSDIEGTQAARLIGAADDAEADPRRGGVQFQGPSPAGVSLPPPSSANLGFNVEPSRFSGQPTWPNDEDVDG